MMAIRSLLRPKVFTLGGVKKIGFLFVSCLFLLFASNFVLYITRNVGTSPSLLRLPDPQLPGSCEGRWIYIYDLDPMFNLDFVTHCNATTGFKKNVDVCSYMENSGMGKSFSFEEKYFANGVWYNTWQFSLEVYFHKRLLSYPCLTPTEETANAFYVPFYAGMDLTNKISHPSLRHSRHKTPVELLDWLRQQYYFLRNGGFDHFITLGRIGLDFRRTKADHGGSRVRFDVSDFFAGDIS
jgi:hypothetical protein